MSPEALTILIMVPALILGGVLGVRFAKSKDARLQIRAFRYAAKRQAHGLLAASLVSFTIGSLSLVELTKDNFAVGFGLTAMAVVFGLLAGYWYGRVYEADQAARDLGLDLSR